MSKLLTDQLMQLLNSLTKAEKRYFKIFATRQNAGKELKFLVLADALDGLSAYDEERVNKKLPGVSPSQLSNLKSHLYEQLLLSLRLLYHLDHEVRIREILDFARVLYQKGLYLQSLGQLFKAKEMAGQFHKAGLLHEAVEFEKAIESRHITRSQEGRAESLVAEAKEARAKLEADGAWSDMAILLYSLYLKNGHIRNEADYHEVRAYFDERKPRTDDSKLTFYGQVSKAQAMMLLHYILQEFKRCYRFTNEWVGLFDKYPAVGQTEPELYLKGLHNLLHVLFFCADAGRFAKAFEKMESFVEANKESFNDNTRIQAFLFVETGRLNRYFLEGKFSEGALYVPRLDKMLKEYLPRLDKHRVLVFWYKMGCMLFCKDDFRGCIRYLNLIVQHSSVSLREDVQCFARILNLIAHYELGDDDLVAYQIRSTYRFLLKLKDVQLFQKAVLQFLRTSATKPKQALKSEFILLITRMEEILQNPYEGRPFLYLDIISWLQSKIENRPVAEVIRAKGIEANKKQRK